MNRTIRLLLFSIATAAACAPAHAADPAPQCPAGSAPFTNEGVWTCRKKLVTGPKKNPNDPCPDGTWWHLSYETCTPVICTKVPNDKALSFSCPVRHHRHSNAVPAGDAKARPFSCLQAYSPENIKTGGLPRRDGECNLCTDSSHAEGRFRPLGSSRSTKAISTPIRGVPFSHASCPSDLFAHNTDGGIRAFSCVEKCPAGTHATPPGDFPYQGAKACAK